MWIPTEDEAVQMFARHFEARHRSGALGKAVETASQLEKKGDQEGYRVWMMVIDRIKELRRSDLVEQRRHTEAA